MEEEKELNEDDIQFNKMSDKRQNEIAKNSQKLLALPGKVELVFLNMPGCGNIKDWQLKGYCIIDGTSPIEQLVTPGYFSKEELKIRETLPNIMGLLIKLGYNTGIIENKKDITLINESIPYDNGNIGFINIKNWKSVNDPETHQASITIAPLILCI